MHRIRRRLAMIWIAAIGAGAVASCGSRTGLFEPDTDTLVHEDPTGRRDGGRDTGRDVASDVPDLDALPPIDVAPKPDVDRTGCADASDTYVYVVTSQYELFSFNPPTLAFTSIGTLSCPSTPGTTPFSMAVDRKGAAFVVYTDGKLFRVSTATAACIATGYVPDQLGFHNFGMGFASDFGGPAEHLFVSENSPAETVNLGRIDVATMKLALIGPFHPTIPRSELTGTGDGRLFAYWPNAGANATGAHIAEVDKQTAEVIARSDLPIGTGIDAFAFAFWGGDFWIFTGQSGSPSIVNRFRPADGTTTMMTQLPSTIVGAGVSTCAPQF